MGGAVRVATLPLRRRRIGLIVVLVGAAMVFAGILLRTTGAPAGPALNPGVAPGAVQAALTQPLSVTGVLQHALGDPLATGAGTRRLIADLALRAGSLLTLAGLLLVILAGAVGLLRGFIGPAAGIGLVGCALLVGVLLGENARAHQALSQADAVSLGPGVWLCVVGFGVALVGGGVAALRPLAGLVSGLSLAVAGVVAGVLVAVVIGGDVTGLLTHG